MKRRLELSEVKPGMVMVDLPHWLKPWIKMPLTLQTWHLKWLQRFKVSAVDIEPELEQFRPEMADSELQLELDLLLDELPVQGQAKQPATTSLALHWLQAEELQHEALVLLRQVFELAQLQHPLPIVALSQLSQRILASVKRAPPALLLLCQLRQPEAYLIQHSLSATVLMALMLQGLEIEASEQPDWLLGCLLMGLGKSQLPEQLLKKTTPLSSQERQRIEQQVELGLQLLAAYDLPELSRRLIAEHHERHDGSGYPLGLTAAQLSLAGELAGLIDVYDALISERSYGRSQPPSRVLGGLLQQQHFRADLVAQLIRCLGVYPVGCLVQLGSGKLGLVLAQGKHWQKPQLRLIYDLRNQCYLSPKDVDLSHYPDVIQGYLDPSRLNLDFQAFI